ncbi:trans-sialidase, putative, partial [Trypanosoma cruzi marinkellei]
MGARTGSEGKNKLMELSYDSEKKWRVVCSGKTNKELSSTLEPDTTEHVVILLRNDNQFSAYVDGKSVGGGAPCKLGYYGFERDLPLLHWRGWRQHGKKRRRLCDCDERPAVQPPVEFRRD